MPPQGRNREVCILTNLERLAFESVRTFLAVISFAICFAATAWGLSPGEAEGTFTFDGKITPLKYASTSPERDVGDALRGDRVVRITSKNENLIIFLHMSGNAPVSVSLTMSGKSGISRMPGEWFKFTPENDFGFGRLTLESRQFDGHTLACDIRVNPAAKPASKSPQSRVSKNWQYAKLERRLHALMKEVVNDDYLAADFFRNGMTCKTRNARLDM